MGIIATTKIKYRHLLLRKIIDNLLVRKTGTHNFPSSSSHGKYGLEEGQLSHVADAIRLFDLSWSSITHTTIVKCWLKAVILPEEHVSVLKNTIRQIQGPVVDLTSPNTAIDVFEPLSLTIPNPLNEMDLQIVHDSWTAIEAENNHENSSADLVQRIFQQNSSRSIRDISTDTNTMMNDRAQSYVSDEEIQKMFDFSLEIN